MEARQAAAYFGSAIWARGQVVEVGVAEVVGAIHVGAAEGLGDDVDLGGGAVGAERGQVIGGEDVEDLDQDDAARGRWGRGDDVVALVTAVDGGAVLHLVVGEVFFGDEASAGLDEGGEAVGDVAVVEVVGVGGDADEGLGEFGLGEGLAGFVEVAVALVDAVRFGSLAMYLVWRKLGLLRREDEAVGGEADGGGHVLREGEAAVGLLGVGEAGDGSGDADGFVAGCGEALDDVLVLVEVHVGGGGGGGALAIVEEVGFGSLEGVAFAVGASYGRA